MKVNVYVRPDGVVIVQDTKGEILSTKMEYRLWKLDGEPKTIFFDLDIDDKAAALTFDEEDGCNAVWQAIEQDDDEDDDKVCTIALFF